MSDSSRSRWRVAAVSLGLMFALATPAPGQLFRRHHYMEDDKIPWGPSGTIGRGTDDPPEVWQALQAEGLPYSPYYVIRGYSGVAVPPRTQSVPAQPYLTTRSYEPGDGYRYPLYYNPATRIYFYYPVAR